MEVARPLWLDCPVSTTAPAIRDEWQRRFGVPAPGKIVCVGLNYHGHAAEQGVEVPGEPLLFGKFANAVGVSQRSPSWKNTPLSPRWRM